MKKQQPKEADRLTLVLPGNQYELIKACSCGKKSLYYVVMQTLGCIEVEEFKNLQNVPGIIWTDTMATQVTQLPAFFGDVNPGGKLMPMYKSVNDLPEITDYTLRGGNGKKRPHLQVF
jgi:hypothetical protein